jgi:hypothetical protein
LVVVDDVGADVVVAGAHAAVSNRAASKILLMIGLLVVFAHGSRRS